MRWLRQSRLVGVVLVTLAAFIYLVIMWGVLPRLWPYREHALVRLLLAVLYSDHLPEALDDLGSGF
jgi:hypothetical protein